MQHPGPADHTLLRQVRLVHTMTPCPTAIRPLRELVNHHPLEHIRLVVDVVEHVFPERVEEGKRHEEPADAHPEAVGKGHDGEGEDEVGEEGGYQHD